MAKSPKVPRASFAVTMLQDADITDLAGTSVGRECLGIFLLVCLLAKDQIPDGKFDPETGKFTYGSKTVAKLIRVSHKTLIKSISNVDRICSINKSSPFYLVDENCFRIPNFKKYNDFRGGKRDNAGRKPELADSKVNQSEIKGKSKGVSSDSVSDSVSDSYSSERSKDLSSELKSKGQTGSLTPDQPSVELLSRSDLESNFSQFWEQYPRKVAKAKARKAYESQLRKHSSRGATPRRILDWLQWYLEHEWVGRPANGTDFPHPSTFLNGEDFTDDPSLRNPTQSGGGGRAGRPAPKSTKFKKLTESLKVHDNSA